jgi:uncharacterized membrane protein YhaH (DUF805 family)
MNWREFLFSFQGRLSRRSYWLFVLLTLPFLAIAMLIDRGSGNAPLEGPGALLALLLLWPSLAVQVKRWHDRDKSGWWVLINFIPIIGDLWSLVENGFLRGTAGSNRFGPDPLVPGAADASA